MIKQLVRPRYRLGTSLGAALAAAAVAVAAPAAPAAALAPNSWGFGFMSAPNAAPGFVLPPGTEASSAGGGAKVTAHPAAGFYTVTFDGIGTPRAGLGVVHVTAAPLKSAPAWCQARAWGPSGANEVIDIVCYQTVNNVTAPVNTAFSVVFNWSSLPAPAGLRFGYLESGGGTGTVTRFDSAGRIITSTLVAPGRWHVLMPGLGGPLPQAGGIQVTTATAQAAHCKVRNWTTFANHQDILVTCFTPTGAPPTCGGT